MSNDAAVPAPGSPPADARGSKRPSRWALLIVVGVLAGGVAGFVAFASLTGISPGIVVALLASVLVVTLVVAAVWRRRRGGSAAVLVMGSVAVATVVVAVAIQAVPYGRAHSNPPVTGEPAWATAETRDLMVRACYGCHSNEVEYPAYASIAPISWAIEQHVNEGRNEVNYSEFATNPGEAEESVEVILDGSMPPAYFTRFGLHPEARLTDEERNALVAGLRATPGLSDDEGEGEGDDDD
jgi:hypothetical protein